MQFEEEQNCIKGRKILIVKGFDGDFQFVHTNVMKVMIVILIIFIELH